MDNIEFVSFITGGKLKEETSSKDLYGCVEGIINELKHHKTTNPQTTPNVEELKIAIETYEIFLEKYFTPNKELTEFPSTMDIMRISLSSKTYNKLNSKVDK